MADLSHSNCLFCKIRDDLIASTKVYEDDLCFAFRDINPQAPTHILIVPRRHITSLNDLHPEDAPLAGHLLVVAGVIAEREGFADKGWRTVFNVGRDGGQTVFHIHLHVLAGRALDWPPG